MINKYHLLYANSHIRYSVMPLRPDIGKQREENPSEFKAKLVYIVNSRPARVIKTVVSENKANHYSE